MVAEKYPPMILSIRKQPAGFYFPQSVTFLQRADSNEQNPNMDTLKSFTPTACSSFAGLLCLLLVLMGHYPLTAQSDDFPHQQIDSLVNIIAEKIGPDGPGLALHVYREGSPVYQKTIGQANLEYRHPLTDRSVFDIASLAKQFTGYAIAKLIVAEKLRLTDDIREQLPEIPDFGTTITVENLLYHTSGLRDIGELCGLGGFGSELTATTALAVLVRQEALNFQPGTQYDYSNSGYVLLALMVERITGQSFPDWCTANIFEPLGMEDSFANADPRRVIANRATAYYGQQGDFSCQQENGMSMVGSSAIFTSLRDMAKWTELFLDPSPADKEVVKLMQTPGKLTNGEAVTYGFGLGINEVNGHRVISHTGATPSGFRAMTAWLPEDNISMVILGNWGGLEPAPSFAHPIFSMLLPEEEKPTEEQPTLDYQPARETLESYAGNYLFNGELNVRFTLEGEDLLVSVEEREAQRLQPKSDTEFFFPAMNSWLIFSAEEGKIISIKVTESGNTVGEIKPKEVTPDFTTSAQSAGTFYSRELGLMVTLSVDQGTLWLTTARHGQHQLSQKSKTVFVPEADFFSKLELIPDETGEVNAFTVDCGSRARGLRFVRWSSVIE